MAVIKKFWWGWGEIRISSYITGGNENDATIWKTVWLFIKMLNMEIPLILLLSPLKGNEDRYMST